MRPFIAISLLTFLLTACGQTGPLYLPKDAPESAPVQAVEPQTPAETSADQPAATDQPAAEVDTQVR